MNSKVFYAIGKREVYNRLLRHMVFTTTILEKFEKGENLADILNEMLDKKELIQDQIPAILRLLLVERAKWIYEAVNLSVSYSDFETLIQKARKWTNINFVLSYYHPTYGIVVVNPAREDHWFKVHELKKDELLVVYAKQKSGSIQIAEKAVRAFLQLIETNYVDEDPDFVAGKPDTVYPAEDRSKAEEKSVSQQQKVAEQKETKRMNITPKYSVQVTNELFHNGNVEAWKNIIEAYHAKYPDCKVIVYYEGELIQDLNSLFKWGKVKHGNVIMFQVVGENIKNVSRLQKYLHEGASPRFEAFLKKDVNKVLNLF